MPNILIIGATGYIGQCLALSLLRSGSHTVYGLARNTESAKLLQSREIIPVYGSITDNAAYLAIIRSAPIDVVVDAASLGPESKILLDSVIAAGRDRYDVAEKTGIRVPKLGFLYVGGTWVHGSSSERVNDLMPVGNSLAPTKPPRLVAWRPVLEQEILSKSTVAVLDVVIVRPALVYGRSNAIWTALLMPLLAAAEGGINSVSLKVDPHSHPALCHIDDVASGLHAAIDKLPFIAGTGVYPVFDLITSQESLRDILTEAGKVLGFNGHIDMLGTGDDQFMEAMCVSTNGSSGRAIGILGWQPKRFGYIQQMSLVAKAWAASLTITT